MESTKLEISNLVLCITSETHHREHEYAGNLFTNYRVDYDFSLVKGGYKSSLPSSMMKDRIRNFAECLQRIHDFKEESGELRLFDDQNSEMENTTIRVNPLSPTGQTMIEFSASQDIDGVSMDIRVKCLLDQSFIPDMIIQCEKMIDQLDAQLQLDGYSDGGDTL